MSDERNTFLIATLLDRIASCLEWLSDDASDDRIKTQARQIALDAAQFRNQLGGATDAN